jgi:predicted amidohydrolase YtcJ
MGVDLLIRNATVLTMTEAMPGAPPQSIAIDAGRICALGSNRDLATLADEGTRVIDLSGKSVLPGFTDSHVHFTQTGLGNLGPQVYGIISHDAVLEVVADALKKTPSGEAVLIHGCCFHELDKPLRLADLDRLAPDKALLVADMGAHACAFNSRAWKMLGLSVNDPGVDKASDGTLSGVLRGAANTRARYAYYNSVVSDETRVAALHRASQMALAVGITTVHTLEGGSPDGRGWLPQRDVEILLGEQGNLPVRTLIYFQSTHVDVAQRWALPRIGGCVWVDGTYFEHTAGLSEPYADQPSSCGCLYFSQSELDAFVWEAHRAGLQISMHAIGDAAIEQLLCAFERALEKEPYADHRHRIEHFSLPTAKQIERAAQLGITASMQPNFAVHPSAGSANQTRTPSLRDLLGLERFQRRHPYRRILEAGILITAGSDADPQPMGPLIGVQLLASHPEEARRLSAFEALKLYTVNPARAAFEEADKGTIAVGKLADLVVLEKNPLTVPPATLASVAVELTIVGGTIAWQRQSDSSSPSTISTVRSP